MRRLIRRLAREGYTAPEAGRFVGMPRRKLYRIAHRLGIKFPPGMGGNARLVAVAVSLVDLAALDDLAAAAGVSRGEFFRRAVKAMLDDRGRALVKRMGRLARRPRTYTREAEEA